MLYLQHIKKYQTYYIIICAMIMTCIISLAFFMEKSLRLDEAQSLFQTNGTFLGTIKLIAADIHLPIYFVLLQFWQEMFGASVISIRSLSLLFLVISLPAMYFLGKNTYSRNIGLVAVIICSLSPFLNWFAAETRMYTLLFLITILNQLYFIRLWNNSGKSSWIIYALTVFVGVYTHYFFTFILFAQALFYVANYKFFPKGSFTRLTLIAFTALGMLGGWFILRSTVGSSNSAPHLVPPGSIDVFNLFSNFFIGFQSETVNTIFLSLWPITVLIGFTFLTKKNMILPQTKYLLITLFTPVVLAFLISSTIKPLFLSRYLIVTVPSLYLLVIHFLSFYPQKRYQHALVILIAISLGSLLLESSSTKIPANENFREAAEYVETHISPSDLFIVSAPFLTYPIEFYYHGDARLTTFPVWNRYEEMKQIPEFSESYLVEKSNEWAKDYSRFFILMGYDQGYEEQTRLYLDTNFERIDVQNFSPGLNLYVYKIKYI